MRSCVCYVIQSQKTVILRYCDFNFIINLHQLTFKYQTCGVQNINKVNESFLMPWTEEYTANNIIKITRIQQTLKYGSTQGKTQSGNKDLKEKSVNNSVCVCVRVMMWQCGPQEELQSI